MLNLILIIILISICGAAQSSPEWQYQINGLDHHLAKNVQARLSTLQETIAKPLQDTDIHKLHQQTPQQIALALQPFGYFQPVISSQLKHNGNLWYGIYQVKTGKALHIASLQLQLQGSGINEPSLQHLRQRFPLQAGSILLSETYEKAKQELLEAAAEQGYLSAKWSRHIIEIDQKKYQAHIKLTLSTGKRFIFGDTIISPTPLSKHFIQGYIPYLKGQAYNYKALLTLQDNLASSPYFKQVIVTPEVNTLKSVVPINLQLTPLPAQQYQAGLGYGTDTGARGSLGWQWRFVNKNGHYLSANITGSEQQNNLHASYTIPGSNPVSSQYTLTANLQNEIYVHGDSHTQQFGLASINSLTPWQRTLSLNFQRDRFRIDNLPYMGSHLLIPGISWVYTESDKPINPNRGKRFSLRVQGAEQALLSDTRFLQTELQSKWLLPINTHSRLVLRDELGYTSVHNLEELPLSLRFYTGGAQSIRGYPYQSLGPGRYKAVGSIEYQHVLKGSWYWTSFYDMGNAWEKLATESTPSRTRNILQHGAGIGFVWHSPIGALQLSAAKAISKQGMPLQLQFSMGPEL